ncbi:MAG: hypothetical protein ACWGOY_14935 [Anaerolineales bacterium]
MNTDPNDQSSLEIPGFLEETITINPACEIANLIEQVLHTCSATRDALSQLRETLISCSDCANVASCELREQFNLQVDQAVSMIIEEWGW